MSVDVADMITPVLASPEARRIAELEGEVHQLRQAVESRSDTSYATGLVAHRYDCTREQAWQLLVRVSQDGNVKLRFLARALVARHEGRPADDPAAERVLEQHLPSYTGVRDGVAG